VTKDDVASLRIPLPPLPEQRRIAAILDKADELRAKRRAALEQLNGLRQALFVSVCGSQSPAFTSWRLVKFPDVCDIEGGTQPPKETFVYEPRPDFVRMLQIQDFKTDEKAVYIPAAARMKRCNEEDVLIGRYGASVGDIFTGKAGAYNVALVKTVPDRNRVLQTFLFHLLRDFQFQNFISAISGRAAQAGFNKSDLHRFEFRLPPMDTQRTFAARLGVLAHVEMRQERQRADLDSLFDSVQQRAFSGAL
jgi:type I restriction enzyme, S subunit